MDPLVIETSCPLTDYSKEVRGLVDDALVDKDYGLSNHIAGHDRGDDRKVSAMAGEQNAVDSVRNELEKCLYLSKVDEGGKESGTCLDSSFEAGESTEQWNNVDDNNNGWDDIGDSKDDWNDAENSKDGWNDKESFNDKLNDTEVPKDGWNGWGDEFNEEDYERGDSYENKPAEVDEEDRSTGVNGMKNKSGFRGGGSSGKFPLRPGADDCPFYMKTGTCKFGSTCKFNHPMKKKAQDSKERLRGKLENSDTVGQIECKYYLRSGGCKYGNSCKFSHSKPIPPLNPLTTMSNQGLESNFLGLPIRQGEKECPFYMRTGSCKYGMNCRFNHPDPSVATTNKSTSSYNNGRSSITPSWPLSNLSKTATSFVPMGYQQHQETAPKPDWYTFQNSGTSHGSPSAYNLTNTITDHGNQQLPIQHSEFPERPDQPDCSHFLKTGDCKYKTFCKYNHPKNRISKTSQCPLNELGLPLRPDQTVCGYYSRYGICKYGPSCKFNHPTQQFSEDQTSVYLSSFGGGAST